MKTSALNLNITFSFKQLLIPSLQIFFSKNEVRKVSENVGYYYNNLDSKKILN